MKTQLAYKSHFTVDGRQRIITAVGVTPAAIEDSTQVVGLLDRQPVRPQYFCADSHYGVAPIYEELRRRGIVAIIPRRCSHTQKSKSSKLSPANFEYDAQHDVYRCPEGKKLKRRAYDAYWGRYHYRSLKSDCEGCALRLACFTPTSIKTITRSPLSRGDRVGASAAANRGRSTGGQATENHGGMGGGRGQEFSRVALSSTTRP